MQSNVVITLTEEQQMLVDTVDDIARNEFAENACEWQGDTPWENTELLAERGFQGVNFPEQYGGGGMSEFEALLMVDTIGRVCPETAELFLTQHIIAPNAIYHFGSEMARERYLPDVIDGTDTIAIAMSEPGGGSDLKSMTTTVENRDGDLVLDGEKMWVGYVPASSAAVVWTKFPDGMGTVILDLDDPGVEIAQHYTNMAGHTQTHFYINEVPIPEENVLTREGDAFKQQLQSLNWERLGAATLTNSVAAGAVERALDYAGDRTQFGQPIGDFQGIEWKIADMVADIQTSRTHTLAAGRAAQKRDSVPDELDSQIAKLQAAQMAEDVVSEALQIHGANGYQQGHDLEFLYRFARGYRIAGGTDEILKNTIAKIVKKEGVPF